MARYTHTARSEGDIIDATKWNALSSAVASDSIAPGYVVAASDSPQWMKDAAHYVCDGTADEVQFQAADDAAYAERNGSTGVAGVYLMPGNYYLSSGISWRAAFFEGIGVANSSVRVNWSGSDNDGPAFARINGVSGGSSFCEMRRLHFRASDGQNQPSIWIDFSQITTDTVDSYNRLFETQFFGGYTQIKIGRYVNVHWEHVRFDNWKTWGIHMIPPASVNQSTFRISGFTWDARHPGTASGWFFLDNSANASNLGTFHFQDARWEVNDNFIGVQGVIQIKVPAASANSRSAKWHFDNVAYQDVDNGDGNMTGDSLIYVDSQGGNYVTQSVVLENFSQTALTSVLGGSTTPSAPIPLLTHYGFLAMGVGDIATGGVNANPSVVTDTIGIHAKPSGSHTNAITSRRSGDSYDMFWVTSNGDIVRNARAASPSAVPGVGLYVGSGAPSLTVSNGSLYQRTDGSGTTDNLYIRRSGAWVGIA
jgi:hypothetical protein